MIDLAVGRWLSKQSTVANGNADRENAAKHAAFERVKPAPGSKCVIVDLADLCQPLWAMPVLGPVAIAREFFCTNTSKWSANQWLVCAMLY